MKDITIFAALADPTRRQLLLDLAKGSSKTATQLAKEYPISRPGLIKHLNILKEAGLVKIYQKGRDKRYVFTPEPLNDLETWLQEINTVWDGNLTRLKALLKTKHPTNEIANQQRADKAKEQTDLTKYLKTAQAIITKTDILSHSRIMEYFLLCVQVTYMNAILTAHNNKPVIDACLRHSHFADDDAV